MTAVRSVLLGHQKATEYGQWKNALSLTPDLKVWGLKTNSTVDLSITAVDC